MQEPYDRMVASGQEFIAAQQLEARVVGMNAEAANRLRYEFDFLKDAQRQGIELTPQQTARLRELAGGMASAETATSRLQEAFDFTRDAVGGFFSDFSAGMRNGEGVWRSFANAATSALDKIVDKLMTDVLNAVFAVGNAGGGGGGGILGKILGGIFGSIGGSALAPASSPIPTPKPFALGGIVSGPTVFPMAKGMGLMGEAGPEAIMPLRRGPGGRLGVEAAGGGGGVLELRIGDGVEARWLRKAEGQSVRIARAESRRGIASLQSARRDDPNVMS